MKVQNGLDVIGELDREPDIGETIEVDGKSWVVLYINGGTISVVRPGNAR